ncbi:hypothetical protein [Micromonospora sp. NPDC051296]|uniref:DUF3488 domain-containing protein n=1 Tax=Micromonospora sp. NPDC051296 TaxID=3155046 RepID=UPI0034175F73
MVLWDRFPSPDPVLGWTGFLLNPELATSASFAGLIALVGLSVGSAMSAYALDSEGASARVGRVVVVAFSVAYGTLLTIYYTQTAAHVLLGLGLIGYGLIFVAFALASWAALGCAILAVRPRDHRWLTSHAAAGPYIVGAATTVVHLMMPQLEVAYGPVALNVLTGTAISGGGLLLIWLAVAGVTGTVDAGRWFGRRVARSPRWTAVLAALAMISAVVYLTVEAIGYFRPASFVHAGVMAVVGVLLLSFARDVDVPDRQQQTIGLVVVLLLFGPRLIVGAISSQTGAVASLIGVPVMLGGAVLFVLLIWAAGRVTRNSSPRRRSLALLGAWLLSGTAAIGAQAALAGRFSGFGVEVTDTYVRIVNVVLKVLSLGFDDHFDAGVVLVGVVSTVLLLRQKTRRMAYAGLFVFAWLAPWLWGGAAASPQLFWVFMMALLGLTLVAAGLGRPAAGLPPSTIMTSLWVIGGVAWWLAYASDFVPDSWARITVPAAFASPAIVPFLLQAQPFNNGRRRAERLMLAAGVAVACSTLALFQVMIGQWHEDLPWSDLAVLFIAMPVAVIAVASLGPHAPGEADQAGDSVPVQARDMDAARQLPRPSEDPRPAWFKFRQFK